MNKKTIKEICLKLSLSIASIHDIFIFYELFTNSKTHQFSNEIILASSIFVSGKISEDPKRIRDIINVLYFVKNKNKLIAEEGDNTELIDLLKRDDFSKKETLLKTMYGISLSNYRIIKEEILFAEQHLLRILSFSFKKMSKEVLIDLITYSERIKLTSKQIQFGWDILLYLYEDLSAYEINSNNTLILCVIINITIEVFNSLNKDTNNDHSNTLIQEQKALFLELQSSFDFDKDKYNSYSMIVLNNYFKKK